MRAEPTWPGFPSRSRLRHHRRSRSLAVALLMLAGCSAGPHDASLLVTHDPLPLASGDRVSVAVFGQDALAAETTIANDGTVVLPLVGRVHLAGLDRENAEQAIADRLRSAGLVVDPRVTVDVVKYRPVYVLGEVGKPGTYDYANNMTVIQAIALAGGYTYRAKVGEATVLRRGSNGDVPVDADDTTRLEPGDVVDVPERWY